MSIDFTQQEEIEMKEHRFKVQKIHSRLKAPNKAKNGDCYPAFTPYTGVDEPLGNSSVYNSMLAAYQLAFTLGSSDHPLVKRLQQFPRHAFMEETESGIADRQFVVNEIQATVEKMVREKIFGDKKILDIGCGQQPTYARCVRELGADVYTIDARTDADKFVKAPSFSDITSEVEKAQHLKVHMGRTDIADIITQHFGDNFDIITSAHIDTDWNIFAELKTKYTHLYQTAASIIKPSGWYFPLPSYRREHDSARGSTLQRIFRKK